MTGLENTLLSDRYFLRKLAGAGGMGQVYQAWDQHRSAYIAIKVIHNARYVESFIREAVALKELAHPNIVRFYSVELDEKKGIAFIVMDWVDGKDLNSLISKKKTPMGIGEVVHYLSGVQSALHYAHARGVCHCDIKPGNIMVKNSDSLPLLSDFGLAHSTHDSNNSGTLAFMAPELFENGKATIASDIYALGVTLYQLLSLHLPFQAYSRAELIQKHLRTPPIPIQKYNPKLPDGIARAIEKALSKDPQKRQKSATELWEDFSKYSNNQKAENLIGVLELFCLQGEKENKKAEFVGAVTLGRSTKSDLRLRHPSVSRSHATIFWKQDRYFIRDNGSTTGTFINSRKLEPHKPIMIRNKDKIRIGVFDVFEIRTRRKKD